MASTSAVTDQLFGTLAHTEGAQYQVPRKIPLRIEPKTYFANERTFLAWLSMATTLGTVATAIAGFSVDAEDETGAKHKRSISPQTVELISLTLLPISVLMIAYALFIFLSRSTNIRKKQIGYFNEKVGPLGLAGIVIVCLTLILVSAIRDVLLSGK